MVCVVMVVVWDFDVYIMCHFQKSLILICKWVNYSVGLWCVWKGEYRMSSIEPTVHVSCEN